MSLLSTVVDTGSILLSRRALVFSDRWFLVVDGISIGRFFQQRRALSHSLNCHLWLGHGYILERVYKDRVSNEGTGY